MTRPQGPPGTRWCPHCATFLPLEGFGTNRSREDGLADWCRRCFRAWWRERRSGGGLVPMPETVERARARSSWRAHLAYDQDPSPDPLAIDRTGAVEYRTRRGWVNGSALTDDESEDVRRRLAAGRRNPHPGRPGDEVARRAGNPPEATRGHQEDVDAMDADYRLGAAVAVLRCRKLWAVGTVTTGDMLEVVGITDEDLARGKRWLAEHPEP